MRLSSPSGKGLLGSAAQPCPPQTIWAWAVSE